MHVKEFMKVETFNVVAEQGKVWEGTKDILDIAIISIAIETDAIQWSSLVSAMLHSFSHK